MRAKRPTNKMIASAVLGMTVALATSGRAQHVPQVRGSLDAVTVVPSTQAVTQAGAPADHPTMPPATQGASAIPGHPAGMNTVKSGAIRVLVSQGTKGGPVIGNDPVTLQLLAKGNVIKTYKATVGEKGLVEIHELPLDIPFQPVLTIEHGGAEQQIVGPSMHKYQPAIEMEMPVYETTTDRPAWTLGLRNILAEPVDLGKEGVGLHFTEMLGGYNPTDRAWTGELEDGERRIITLALPAGARDVQFGPGLAEAGAKVVHNSVVRGKTMLPGSTEYVFGYVLAPKDGNVMATFTAPADTTLFALYFPGDAKVETSSGLEIGQVGGAHSEQSRQLLKAKSIAKGQTVSVTLSGLKLPPPPPKAVEPLPQTTDLHLPVPTTAQTKPERMP